MLLHQLAIIVIAYFVVQWSAGLWLKAGVVAAGSLAVSIALYELFIKRVPPLQAAFGMKTRRLPEAETGPALALPAPPGPVKHG